MKLKKILPLITSTMLLSMLSNEQPQTINGFNEPKLLLCDSLSNAFALPCKIPTIPFKEKCGLLPGNRVSSLK